MLVGRTIKINNILPLNAFILVKRKTKKHIIIALRLGMVKGKRGVLVGAQKKN